MFAGKATKVTAAFIFRCLFLFCLIPAHTSQSQTWKDDKPKYLNDQNKLEVTRPDGSNRVVDYGGHLRKRGNVARSTVAIVPVSGSGGGDTYEWGDAIELSDGSMIVYESNLELWLTMQKSDFDRDFSYTTNGTISALLANRSPSWGYQINSTATGTGVCDNYSTSVNTSFTRYYNGSASSAGNFNGQCSSSCLLVWGWNADGYTTDSDICCPRVDYGSVMLNTFVWADFNGFLMTLNSPDMLSSNGHSTGNRQSCDPSFNDSISRAAAVTAKFSTYADSHTAPTFEMTYIQADHRSYRRLYHITDAYPVTDIQYGTSAYDDMFFDGDAYRIADSDVIFIHANTLYLVSLTDGSVTQLTALTGTPTVVANHTITGYSPQE